MNQLLLLRSHQPENRYGRFAAEILSAEGLAGFAAHDLDTEGFPSLLPGDLALLTRCFLRQAEIEALFAAVHSGVSLVCLQPHTKLLERFGWRPRRAVLYPGRVRPRPGSRGAGLPLQTHLPVVLVDPGDTAPWRPLADALSDDGAEAGTPAVATQRAGAGTAAWFLYDLPQAVARIRFGDPELASYETTGWWDWCHATDLCAAADDALGHVPQADLHGQLLAQVLTALAPSPLARFWYYARAEQNTAAMFSSDDDWSTPEQFRTLEAALARRGARATFYLVEGTSLTDATIAEFRQRGHTFAPHVNAAGPDDRYFDFPRCLRDHSAALRARIGATSPSLQAHCAPWYGYVGYAREYRREGYRLLLHYLSLPGHRLHRFPAGSGRPLRFVDSTGEVLDVWQQPGVTYDDASLAERIRNDRAALAGDFAAMLEGCLHDHHTAIALASHPVSFATYSQPFIEDCLDLLLQAGVPISNGDEWCALQDRRRAVRASQETLAEGTLRCLITNLDGPLPLMIPGRTAEKIAVDGRPAPALACHRLGQDYLVLQLHGEPGQEIVVEVSGLEDGRGGPDRSALLPGVDTR